ncbi:MAG: hypothetical protein HFI87_01280 [Bacilli bacterium]|nr:hypothetical protein [Bacilli bacterium]
MKKIGKILFAFLFTVVGIFGMGTANAEDYTIRFDNQYYEYYMTGGNGKLDMSIANGEQDIFKQAIAHFYRDSLTSQIVDVVPLEFKVKDGQTWDSKTDSATMYINIPKNFNMGYDNGQSIYLLRIKVIDGEIQTYAHKIQSSSASYTRLYEIKDRSSIESIITSNNVTSSGKNLSTDYFTNQFATLQTSEFNATGTTYYMLITCKGEVPPEPTKPTNPTEPTQPTETTTIENPKTADVSSQLYIVIGAICLAGIAGLGVKFAKSNK